MSEIAVHKNEVVTIWPMLLDYNQRECLQILRRLELEAYSKIVAVLRAQGPLTEEKRKLLTKLQYFLSISIDRHKAEVRRALNDEELATISEAICGKEVDEEWILEGKRISPIFHRPSPETVYLPQANKIAFEQLLLNYKLPKPCDTIEYHKFITSAQSNENKKSIEICEDKQELFENQSTSENVDIVPQTETKNNDNKQLCCDEELKKETLKQIYNKEADITNVLLNKTSNIEDYDNNNNHSIKSPTQQLVYHLGLVKSLPETNSIKPPLSSSSPPLLSSASNCIRSHELQQTIPNSSTHTIPNNKLDDLNDNLNQTNTNMSKSSNENYFESISKSNNVSKNLKQHLNLNKIDTHLINSTDLLVNQLSNKQLNQPHSCSPTSTSSIVYYDVNIIPTLSSDNQSLVTNVTYVSPQSSHQQFQLPHQSIPNHHYQQQQQQPIRQQIFTSLSTRVPQTNLISSKVLRTNQNYGMNINNTANTMVNVNNNSNNNDNNNNIPISSPQLVLQMHRTPELQDMNSYLPNSQRFSIANTNHSVYLSDKSKRINNNTDLITNPVSHLTTLSTNKFTNQSKFSTIKSNSERLSGLINHPHSLSLTPSIASVQSLQTPTSNRLYNSNPIIIPPNTTNIGSTKLSCSLSSSSSSPLLSVGQFNLSSNSSTTMQILKSASSAITSNTTTTNSSSMNVNNASCIGIINTNITTGSTITTTIAAAINNLTATGSVSSINLPLTTHSSSLLVGSTIVNVTTDDFSQTNERFNRQNLSVTNNNNDNITTSTTTNNNLAVNSTCLTNTGSSNNVIVLHKGLPRKMFTTTNNPSIRFGSNLTLNTTQSIYSTHNNPISHTSITIPNRHIRIVGLKSANNISNSLRSTILNSSSTTTTTTNTTTNFTTITITPTSNTITTTTSNVSANVIEPLPVLSSGLISSSNSNNNLMTTTLLNSSHLSGLLDVDLDSDSYNEQINHITVNPATITNISVINKEDNNNNNNNNNYVQLFDQSTNITTTQQQQLPLSYQTNLDCKVTSGEYTDLPMEEIKTVQSILIDPKQLQTNSLSSGNILNDNLKVKQIIQDQTFYGSVKEIMKPNVCIPVSTAKLISNNMEFDDITTTTTITLDAIINNNSNSKPLESNNQPQFILSNMATIIDNDNVNQSNEPDAKRPRFEFSNELIENSNLNMRISNPNNLPSTSSVSPPQSLPSSSSLHDQL